MKYILAALLCLMCAVQSSGQDISTAEAVLYATGFTFPEGPVFNRDGDLYLVNFKGTVINKVSPAGEVSTVVDIGTPNNGAIFDRAGNLYIASSGRGAILMLDAAKNLKTAAATSDGDSLLGPNDMAWDNSGRLYFTDPKGSSERNLIGGIHYIGADGTAHRFAGGLAYPNGIAFSPDNRYLYITETGLNRLLRYEVHADGTAGARNVMTEFPKGSVPDGMKIDAEGNLWVAVHALGEIWRISSAGIRLGTVKLPTKYVTNLVFGGPDRKTIYVTAFDEWQTPSGNVYAVHAGVAGAPAFE
ncbi:MAG: SMP-30/gluconolactonase/LRE family protein [Candidatus Latescibacterota bacterium]